MSAYWIALVEVSDAETYGKYARIATKAIEEHGGKFLARGGRTVPLEGKHRARNVIVEFPSVEAAEKCYNSNTYAEALKLAKVSAERDMLIVEGV